MIRQYSAVVPQQFRVPAVNWDPVAAEILSFLRLPKGWHYGKGVPASADAVLGALQFFPLMKGLAFGRFEAFPEIGGGILLSSFHGDNIVEILFRADGRFDVTVERASSFEELESAESIDKVTALGTIWKIGNSTPSRLFNSSIPGTIAEKSVDSRVLAFRNFDDGLSVVEPCCAAKTSRNLCEHLPKFYPDISSEPPIYWRIAATEFPRTVSFVRTPSTTGDYCHFVAVGGDDNEYRRWFKSKSLSDFEICVEDGPRPPTHEEAEECRRKWEEACNIS